MNQIKFLEASSTPTSDLKKVSYEGQPERLRQYRHGYSQYLDRIPVIEGRDWLQSEKAAIGVASMRDLGNELVNASWVKEGLPEDGGFSRTILGMESPKVDNGGLREGAEILVAKWGKGFSSPVHGHKEGLLYEQLLTGKMLVNMYRIVDKEQRIVRPVRTDVYNGNQEIVAGFGTGNGTERSALVHNFVTVEPSASLHYVAEHTRDGRDNKFTVEYFDDRYALTPEDVERIDSRQGLASRIGDVILVDSSNVPEYGKHYIVITGHPVIKEHGLRPQDVAIAAPTNKLLDGYEQRMGLTLLRLKPQVAQLFREFHGIRVTGTEVFIPQL